MSMTPPYSPGIVFASRRADEGELFLQTDAAWEFVLANVPNGAQALAGCGSEVYGMIWQLGEGFAVELRSAGYSIGFAPAPVAGEIIASLTERGPGILTGTVLIAEPEELRIYLALYTETDVPATGKLETTASAEGVYYIFRVEVNALEGAVN